MPLNGHFSAAEAINDYAGQIARMAPGSSWRDRHRLTAAGASMGTRPEYDQEQLDIERQARLHSQGRNPDLAAMTDAEKDEALDRVIAGRAEALELTAPELDDMLIAVAGGGRDAGAKAWALDVVNHLGPGGRVVNPEAEIVTLSSSGRIGRQVVDSPDKVREAWRMLHDLGNRQFYDDAALHGSIAAKIRSKARSYRVKLDGDDGQGWARRGSSESAAPYPGAGEGGEGPSGDLAASLVLALSHPDARIGASGEVYLASDDGENILDVESRLDAWHRDAQASAFQRGHNDRTPPKPGPKVRSGRPLNPKTDDMDPSDKRKIEAILRRNRGVEGLPDISSEDPHGSVTRIPPMTLEQRMRDQRRERAGGRPQTGEW